jgi:glycosyltransferase involved in cell wall biosynthesis
MKNLVIIPAYNEEEALPKTVAKLQSLPDGFELLVINDGSSDHTGATAARVAGESKVRLHVVHLPVNCGIGVAVQTGYLFAARQGGYRYVIQFDGDGQHDASRIPALVEKCDREGLDFCIGSRFLGNADVRASTWQRRSGIRFFAWLIRLLSGTRVTDPTSGFRCAGPAVWMRFARHYPEDYPEPETLFWCARNRIRMGEIPVPMLAREGGISSINWQRATYYMIKVSLAILFDRLRSAEYVKA